MALLLPLLNEPQSLMSTLLGGDHLRLKLSDDDFLSPLMPKKTRRQIISSPYLRHPNYKGKHYLITNDNKNFHVNIDVQQFSPEEITVKCINNDTIVVECKHEEKPDEHGYISRHFVRKYKVPKGHDVAKCVSKLSSDGVLTITAPKVEKKENAEIEIPITFTNQPSRVQDSTQEVAEEEKTKKQKS
ncbi:alpha-crystallin B chain-like [Anoplophora glabripennis]|uniref:alpha-crystallin B chain-like n=1 Tax=Anoplophora glabripennis TaxID=217634 RepID=UPI000875946F|nr:alpha-crystallin B chain-like [Anoplophora glabripennis]